MEDRRGRVRRALPSQSIDRLIEHTRLSAGRTYISALLARSDSLSQQVGRALCVLAEEGGCQPV
jgi:hypothetical protein